MSEQIRKFLGLEAYIPHWSSQKVKQYEQETHKYLGRLEPHYAWSHQFRPEKADTQEQVDP